MSTSAFVVQLERRFDEPQHVISVHASAHDAVVEASVQDLINDPYWVARCTVREVRFEQRASDVVDAGVDEETGGGDAPEWWAPSWRK